MSPVAEFRETEADAAARVNKIKFNLIKIAIAVLLTVWGSFSNGATVGLIMILLFGAAVILSVFTIDILRSLNMPSLVALVDAEGVKLRRSNGQIQDILWPDVRYIDAFDQQEQKPRPNFYVSFQKPNGAHESLSVPLQSMPQPISERFIKTIEHYRPNLYASWQDQLSYWNGVDSGAR